MPVVHELGLCNCFKPRDLAELLERERLWFELLMRLTRYRMTVLESARAKPLS
jgi:hypothetical protein